ncbi:MAG: NTP transferase domain-containing protein [Candidatus Omnitrophica bacterium]|nr:NTP transferase domain-containing protein [Candidatus Omnitrophota bacterium]
MRNFKCLILAAGKGTRMESFVPKVLQPICGKPMLGYIIKLVKKIGIRDIIAVISNKSQGQQVKKFLGKDIKVVEQKQLLGTAHAVNQARRLLKDYEGNLLVLYGDTPLLTEVTVDKLLEHHVASGAACTLLTTIMKNPTGYGRIVKDGLGRIKAIIEEKDTSIYERVIEDVNVGIYCFKSKDLFLALKKIRSNNTKKEFYLTDIIKIFYAKGLKTESVTTESSEEILGMNSKNDLAKAHDIVRWRILSRLMESGVTIMDPSATFIDEEAVIGKDTIIYPHVMIEGKNYIGKNCKVGPFCRIRGNCHIEDNVLIGNFVELVRTSIKSNTKIKHQCYLGDAEVGSGVNMGAATIIDNYDGKKKYKTIIEDKVLIGAGVILIAPAKIGRAAVCGAGAIISKNTNIKPNSKVAGASARFLHKKRK